MADKVPRLERAKLRTRLLAEFERVVEEVSDAIDDAPAGRIIRDSEEKARDTLARIIHERRSILANSFLVCALRR